MLVDKHLTFWIEYCPVMELVLHTTHNYTILNYAFIYLLSHTTCLHQFPCVQSIM